MIVSLEKGKEQMWGVCDFHIPVQLYVVSMEWIPSLRKYMYSIIKRVSSPLPPPPSNSNLMATTFM